MSVPISVAVAVVAVAGIIALGVLLIVSRRQLKGTRRQLERSRQNKTRRRRHLASIFRE